MARRGCILSITRSSFRGESRAPLNFGDLTIERKLVPHSHVSFRELVCFMGKAYMSSWYQLSQSRSNGRRCLGMRG